MTKGRGGGGGGGRGGGGRGGGFSGFSGGRNNGNKGGERRGNRRDNNSGNNRKKNWSRGYNGDGGGFRKFSGTNSMSPREYRSDQHQFFNSRMYNNHNSYNNHSNQMRVENNFQGDTYVDIREDIQVHSEQNQTADSLEQPVQNNEKLVLKFKTEKPNPPPTEPKQTTKSPKLKAPPVSSSESESDREDTSTTKPAEITNSVSKIRIKQEIMDSARPEKKEAVNKALPASRPSAPPVRQESSSSSDSSSSSSSEEEEPPMPHPIRGGDVKPKKEKKSEDDVVCLGKVNKIENLADSDDPSVCIVCNKPGHTSDECQMKCRKCSHSSYQCQIVCKHCGETYTSGGARSLPKPPNPFMLFMQFMQFCMSQYADMFTDVKFSCPPSENPVQCPEQTPTAEVSRKDIENSRTNRKRRKSESKQKKKARKNCPSSTDEESDSDSIAASSSKKRKKRAKSSARETETPPVAAQQQAQQQPFGQAFGQSYPANLPFAGSFNSPGFNPMMAFSQMMGYNPVAMNFTR